MQRSHATVMTHVLRAEEDILPSKIERKRMSLLKQLKECEMELAQKVHNRMVSLNFYLVKEQEYADLEAELKKLDTTFESWKQQRSILLPGTLSSLIQTNRLLDKPPEMFFLNNDLCQKCQKPNVFRSTTSQYICIHCARMNTGLFVPEDLALEKLGQSVVEAEEEDESAKIKNENEADDTKPKKMKKVTPAINGTTNIKSKKKQGKFWSKQTEEQQKHKRDAHDEDIITGFLDYLSQFKTPLPIVPNNLFNQIALHLLLNRTNGCPKVSHPFIRDILKQYPEYGQFMSRIDHVVRIYNCEVVPELEEEWIQTMVERFRSLRRICTKTDDKKKVFMPAILAAMLLRINDNEAQITQSLRFQLAKTRGVVSEANTRLSQLICEARQQEPQLWQGINLTPLF